MKRLAPILALFIASPAFAQSNPSPAKMGIVHSASPEVVSVLDKANVWAQMGTIDTTTHAFTPTGVSLSSGTCDPGIGGAPCPSPGTMLYFNTYLATDSKLPAFAATPAFTISGTLPGFTTPPTVNIGTGAGGQGFSPNGAITPFNATSVSQTTAIPGVPGNTILLVNSASNTNQILHCTLGAGPAVASDQTIQPGSTFAFQIGSATQFACMVSSGSQLVSAVAGTGSANTTGGLYTGTTGGGGGAVTIAGGADVATGNTTDAAWALTGNSTVVSALKAAALANGAVGDAAWSGSGNATEIAALKAVYAQLLNVVAGINAGYDSTTQSTRTSRVSLYPLGAVPITASAVGTTAATAATLAGVSAKTTYICGFSIRANANGAVTANSTVSGTISGTLNFTQWTASNSSGLGVTEQLFSPCVPASAVNTGIVTTSAAPGTGGVVSVAAWGFQM